MSETSISGNATSAAFKWASGMLLCAVLLLASPVATQSPNEALFQAVELNDIEATKAAISAGADLSAKNANGMTPADVAVDLGHFRIAHLLLAKRTEAAKQKPSAPRVTEKGKAALKDPRARLAAPRALTPAAKQAPKAKLADIVPPKKPDPAPEPAPMASTTPPTAEPENFLESIPSVDTSPTETQVPAQPAQKPKLPEPRPDDEIAKTAPASKPAETAVAETEEPGLFDNIWGGVKSVVTLGGLIGGSDPETGRTPLEEQRGLSSPADRFTKREPPSDSSAGRMVDRMTSMIGDKPAPENEFGLPSQPVVSPPPLDEPSLVAPSLEALTLEAPALPGDLPGSETAELVPSVEDPLLSVPSLEQQPNIEVPGVTDPLTEIPGVVELGVPPTTGTDQIPGAPSIGVASELPDGPAPPDPSDEVPGIIPPPSDTADSIPALPPGLEPLPGSRTGELRRPGGLIEPRDTDVLPPPDQQTIRQRLKRLEGVLGRAPSQNLDRYGKPRTPPPIEPAPRAAPAQTVETLEKDPLMEIPKGLASEAPRPSTTRDRPSPDEILRKARESDLVRAERAAQAARTGFPKVNTPRPLEPSGHQLPLPDKDITTRAEPSSRMMARISNLTGDDPYENEDIHGLPVIRPSVDGTSPPRKEIAVEQLPESREEVAERELTKLARFFRGDQEEEAGMRPPPSEQRQVQKEALPRVIDNLLPENDPARNRVVDDKLLDLRGVEYEPSVESRQAGSSSRPTERLNENFIDKLTTVLGKPPETIPQPSTTGPEPGTIGLEKLDVPDSQIVKPAKPAIPDPWTMTVERKDGQGQSTTLGVTSISPEDGSEITPEEGVVSGMVGRIRQLLTGPEDIDRGPAVDKLDEQERQAAAERVLSEALRDGTPTALPDQGQWPVTEVEMLNATPGVPPKPRSGVLTRTSLDDVVLSLGESVTLENTLPPQQDGIDPLNSCIKKNRGTTLFCVEPVDWPDQLRNVFVVPTILYTGPMAITRYDQGSPSRFHVLFDANEFEDVVTYYQARYGEPTEIWKRSIAPLAKPRMDNPTVTWRSRDSRSNVITVLEIRKFDDTRGGFPDINRGAVMLYHFNAPSIFPQVSSHELMRLRRANR